VAHSRFSGLFQRLPSSSRGLAAIVAGTGGGQVALLVSAPIISRIYSPADIGLFSLVTALAMTLGVIAALRFDLAIPLPQRDRDAHALVALGLCSAVIICLLGLTAAGFLRNWAAEIFNQPRLTTWLFFAPVIAGVIGVFGVLNQFALRQRRYTSVARRNLLQSIASVMAQVGLGLVGLRTGGMIIGFGAGQAVGVLSLMAGSALGSDDARQGRRPVNLRAVARRYGRFPLLLAPSGLLNILGLQAPILLISWLYGGDIAGWLGMTQRILALPMSLVGLAVGQVFLAEMSRAAREDAVRARAIFSSVSRRLALFGGLLFAVLVGCGPWLFSVILGDQWRESGAYGQALAAGLALQLIASPLSQTLIVYERTLLQLGWDAGRVVAVVSAILVAAAWGSPRTTVWAFGLVTASAYAVSWALSYRTVTRRARPTVSPPAPPVTRCGGPST
jgi:O-antigen/teichoic acid export membrane protein